MMDDEEIRDTVCPNCVYDKHLKRFIKISARFTYCDYCKRRSKKDIAASSDELFEHIGGCISSEWEDPADHLPYDGREGGYQVADVIDTTELLHLIDPISENDTLIEDLLDYLERDKQWFQMSDFYDSENEALRYDWNDFCEEVKTRRRYLFLVGAGTKKSTLGMLRKIALGLEELSLVKTIPVGSIYYRARLNNDSKIYSTVEDLGPPKFPRNSNRMSPAGIPMFYGATDPITANVEVSSEKTDKRSNVTIGEFRTLVAIDVLDLTNMPEVPSIFSETEKDTRERLRFLKSFVLTVSSPIKHDGREHIEFVPTQVFTEYIRHAYKTRNGNEVKGIHYLSSRTNKPVCVLFLTQDNVQTGTGIFSQQILNLDKATVGKVIKPIGA